MRWTFDIEAAQGQVVSSATVLRTRPEARSMVLCVSAVGHEGTPVRANGGLHWSDSLRSSYTYVGGDEGPVYDRAFTFEAPVAEVSLQLLRWPSREPIAMDEVVSQTLQLAAWDRTGSMANAEVLVLPRPEVTE